jgi:ribosomal protein L14E/L6E/L27E
MAMKQPDAPQPGQLVRNLRGRDAGKLAVIIGIEDERFVLIADGDKRKFDQPKKKNLLHLELLGFISGEVASSIRDTGRVTNGKLRYAIGKYVEDQPTEEAQEKGE